MRKILYLFLLLAVSVSAGQITPLPLEKLHEQSKLIVLGRVTKVDVKQDNGVNGKSLMATVKVVSVMKGKLYDKSFQVPLSVGGVRGFDPALTKGQSGVFFLTGVQQGFAIKTKPGSIALFPDGYFP